MNHSSRWGVGLPWNTAGQRAEGACVSESPKRGELIRSKKGSKIGRITVTTQEGFSIWLEQKFKKGTDLSLW